LAAARAAIVITAVMGLAAFSNHILLAVASIIACFLLLSSYSSLAAAVRAQKKRADWYGSAEPALRNAPGYPGDWRLRRIEVFIRAGGVCESCGATVGELKVIPLAIGRTVPPEKAWHFDHTALLGAHVHHKLQLSKGGSHALSNLELLCDNCHAAKHPQNAYLRNFRENVEREQRRRSLYFGEGASVKRARREWTCYICERPIPPGDEYFAVSHAKVCLKCKETM
jgi:5-methylcytosine-specific restriction endonuclease McrA